MERSPMPVRTGEGLERIDLQFNHFMVFKTYTQQYTQTGPIDVFRWTNAISVKNNGTSVVVVMGDPMQPGETKSIGGNAFEIYDEKHFTLQFNPAGIGGLVNSAIITQKYYVGMTRASAADF